MAGAGEGAGALRGVDVIGAGMAKKTKNNSNSASSRKAAPVQATSTFEQGLTLHRQGKLAEARAMYEAILAGNPRHFDALNMLGAIAAQICDYQTAVDLLENAIEINPHVATSYNNLGYSLQNLNRQDEALESYAKALLLQPDYAEAYLNRGNVLKGLHRLNEALTCYDKALELKPDYAVAFFYRGIVLLDLNRTEEALASYDGVVALQPDNADVHISRGIALEMLGRLGESLASYDRALSLQSDNFGACLNRGNVLLKMKRPEEALTSYNQALPLKPDYAEAYNNRGNALKELKRLEEALVSYEEALEFKPDYAEAHYNRGIVLHELKRLDEALACYSQAVAIRSDYAEAYNNRGNALKELKRLEEALVSYEQALEFKRDYAEAYNNRGIVLQLLRRLDEALASYDQALAIKPDYEFIPGTILHIKTQRCDWSGIVESLAGYEEGVRLSKRVTVPFPALALVSSAALHHQAARVYAASEYPSPSPAGDYDQCARGGKIRIGYFSADFHDHATTHLMAELFEIHDRSRFELYGFSFGPDQQDEMRRRVSAAFHRFIDVREVSDRDVARRARELGIHIAVDLKGFTQDARPGIFAQRCAPVQVNYLGYPGTMGAKYMDYLVADRVVIPQEAQQEYTEKIVYLPNSYQVNDAQRPISGRVFSRRELGLPETGFVFCCFNNNYKILPATFDIWMRLLKRVEGSVLWLLADNPTAERNLRREAEVRGVAESRLLFAQRLPLPEHLARHRCADLFLDTLPCNAHTTASDALWAGLPLLTCRGESFAGRVAASLLTAIGLPELIARTPEEYEEKAYALATDGEMLSCLKLKLERNRLTTPLFDTRLYTRHLESAYAAMYERWQDGLAPEHLEIASLSDDVPLPLLSAGMASMAGDAAQYEAKLAEGLALHQQGKLAEAREIYTVILAGNPRHFDSLNLLGCMAGQAGDYLTALEFFEKAIAVKADSPATFYNHGNALQQLKRLEEAVISYDQALVLKPDFTGAHINRGNVLKERKRLDEALISYDQALAFKPDSAEAFYNRGIVLEELKRLDEALASYDQALLFKPDCAEAFYNRGIVLQGLQRLEEAVASYDQALVLRNDYADAYNNRGNVLQRLGRLDEAVASYDQALLHKHDFAEACNNRGNVLKELKRLDVALASYRRALAIKPDYEFLSGTFLHTKMQLCDWEDISGLMAGFEEGIRSARNVTTPFPALALVSSPMLQQQVSRIYAAALYPAMPLPAGYSNCTKEGKIRIGYFSADFHDHATTHLMAEMFEVHDRNRFELYGFSFGPEVQDEMRRRVAAAFHRFIDVRGMNDRDVARMSQSLGIHIAVDLKGYTTDARPGIFAQRCAPVQVNYLGYPGTMGAEYMDYLIADRVVIPRERQQEYTEKIVYLPHSYQVNDAHRTISERVVTRSELGLPETGFVLCCFNNNYKILPATFDIWMRLLKRVEGSVLWLLADNPTAERNLRREAVQRGVAESRLLFAQRLPLPEHLARHRVADLFLDTLPCNAHTTASDALWAGLPLLTCLGESFAGRVAASLLTAIGLPELIAKTPEEYEEKAYALATDGVMLSCLKLKLERNRLTTPLFDTQLYTRHLESAYAAMYEQWLAGLAPEQMEIAPLTGTSPLSPLPGGGVIAAEDAAQHQILFRQGLELHQRGRLAEARAVYEAILAGDPLHFDSLNMLGAIAVQSAEYEKAIDLIGKAIEINPHIAISYNNLGYALRSLKRSDEALSNYEQAIALNPDYAEAYYNRANLLKEVKRQVEALASYNRVLELKPDHVDAHIHRGILLEAMCRLEDSLAGYDIAIALQPDNSGACLNRGNVLLGLNRIDDAVENYDNALMLGYNYEEVYCNKALALLLGGRFDKGWELYEWRLDNRSTSLKRRHFSPPLWLGSESLAGKTILLHSEQGLGDTIQFCRYARMVAGLGAIVIMEIPASLLGLFHGLAGVARFITAGSPLPEFDYHCPLPSLPLAFRTTVDSIPGGDAYLSSDAVKAALWADRLGEKKRPRVGIAWSGSTGHKNDHNRSFLLSQLVPYLPEGLEYVSLQKELRDSDAATLRTYPALRHFGEELHDFSETAALCEQMDLIVSVDTSVAHLSGALGKPAWIILPYSPDWRWLLGRDDSPWYPSVKLYRQERPGDWVGGLNKLREDLAKLAAGGPRSSTADRR